MDKNLHEAMKWFRQGEKDLGSSKNSLGTADFEWACFQAQQGFRKILTHSVYDLIREIGKFDPSFTSLKKEAKILDAVYITTRYPDSIVGNLTPFEYF